MLHALRTLTNPWVPSDVHLRRDNRKRLKASCQCIYNLPELFVSHVCRHIWGERFKRVRQDKKRDVRPTSSSRTCPPQDFELFGYDREDGDTSFFQANGIGDTPRSASPSSTQAYDGSIDLRDEGIPVCIADTIPLVGGSVRASEAGHVRYTNFSAQQLFQPISETSKIGPKEVVPNADPHSSQGAETVV